jgi:hypothetical protein
VFDRLDRADAGDREDIALFDRIGLNRLDRRGLEIDPALCNGAASAIWFVAHIDHLCVAVVRDVCEI